MNRRSRIEWAAEGVLLDYRRRRFGQRMISARQAAQTDKMDKIYQQTLLYDFYGDLLTGHQRSIFEEVVFEDCSLSEVAERHGVSRQGVHDIVKRSARSLEGYEEKLGLVKKFLSIRDKVNEIRSLTEDDQIRRLTEEILEEL